MYKNLRQIKREFSDCCSPPAPHLNWKGPFPIFLIQPNWTPFAVTARKTTLLNNIFPNFRKIEWKINRIVILNKNIHHRFHYIKQTQASPVGISNIDSALQILVELVVEGAPVLSAIVAESVQGEVLGGEPNREVGLGKLDKGYIFIGNITFYNNMAKHSTSTAINSIFQAPH